MQLKVNAVLCFPDVKESSATGDNATSENLTWLSLPLVPEVTVTVLKESGSLHIPLFLAAPIQGSADPLLQVAQSLDRPVYGLQYPPDLPCQSITQVARALVQVGCQKQWSALQTEVLFPNW